MSLNQKEARYLVICLGDTQLQFLNLRATNTLKTIDYDCDYNVLVFQINKNTSDFLTLKTRSGGPRYKYKDKKVGNITKSARKELRLKYPQQCQPNKEANRLVYRRNRKTCTNRPSRIHTRNETKVGFRALYL